MIHNIPQPDFEEFIYQRLQVDPNTEVRKGVAFVSCEQASMLFLILHLITYCLPPADTEHCDNHGRGDKHMPAVFSPVETSHRL